MLYGGFDLSQLNKDPFGESWLVKLKGTEPKDLNALLDASAYREREALITVLYTE